MRAGVRVEELTSDQAWVRAMLDAEAALTRAQARAGLVPEEAAALIGRAAAELDVDVPALARRARRSANPVVPLVSDLREAAGAAASHVHLGATSQDILDTAAMLVARRASEAILADLDAVAASLAGLAERHRTTVMAARTLGQQAVPTTFGLKAATWLAGVLRARDRLAAVPLPAQLGGAAGTLSALTEATEGPPTSAQSPEGAEAAGTSLPTPHQPGEGRSPSALTEAAEGASARAQSSEGAGAAETPSPTPHQPGEGRTSEGRAASGVGEHPPSVGERALRVVELFAQETGLVAPEIPWHAERSVVADLGAALAGVSTALGKIAADVVLMSQTEVGEVAEASPGGSSAMPHKRNPALSVLIRAASLQVPVYAQALAQVGEHERAAGAWQAEWSPLRECLRLTGGAAETAAELTAGLQVFPGKMRANAGLTGGRIVSERLAAHLGRDALTETLRRDGPLDAPADLLDPSGYLGAAPALTDRVLAAYRDREGHQ
ncbi:lyase family protein [Nonomuraea sp. NPDC050478]|uniref:lyase family protein n=1 Tax=Nonomuraea sp. NPDC050478 TaxID=3364365 RepID=UPI0037A77AAB